MSRLRSFAVFKAQVERRFGEESDPESPENLDAVARVFHATEHRENLGALAPEPQAWDRSLRLIEGFLRAFAREHLDRASLYNAAKHGLALTPTEMGFQMGDRSVLKVEGPIIQYLQVSKDAQGRARWEQVAHWVRADRQMGLIYRAMELIETLWRTARYRYLPAERATRYKFHLVTGPTFGEMLFAGREPAGGVEVNELTWQLIYEKTDIG